MQQKHIDIRIKQCLALAEASNCPRRKFGALLLDPTRNVILMDGYNGGPRGSKGALCKSWFCERDGLRKEDFTFQSGWVRVNDTGRPQQIVVLNILYKDTKVHYIPKDATDDPQWRKVFPTTLGVEERAALWVDEQVENHKPVPSGVTLERGCHHAEMNVLCNAAANGVKTEGAWIIVTGEPCLMCAKLLHHAGVLKVFCVKGGYKGGDEGPEYLRENGVKVEYVDGPQDPR